VPSPETEVFDFNGQRIFEGSRVKIEWHDEDGEEKVWIGTVKTISDPDGDADLEGNLIGINPRVWVKWDEGEEESFSTSVISSYADPSPEYGCDDLEVVK
jgi:hypothetical protein